MMQVIPKFLLLVAVVIGCLSDASPVVADEADEQFELAAKLYKSQRWNLAADAFRTFTVKHSTHKNIPVARL